MRNFLRLSRNGEIKLCWDAFAVLFVGGATLTDSRLTHRDERSGLGVGD